MNWPVVDSLAEGPRATLDETLFPKPQSKQMISSTLTCRSNRCTWYTMLSSNHLIVMSQVYLTSTSKTPLAWASSSYRSTCLKKHSQSKLSTMDLLHVRKNTNMQEFRRKSPRILQHISSITKRLRMS